MKKSKYRRLKSLSFILSVIMIMCSIPMTAIADTADSTETTEDDSYVYDVMETEEIELEATEIAQITEVESLREENVKHFKMPDGTYEMIVYGEAVHRKDSDGKWQNIDNNLELTAVKNVNMFASSDMRTTFASSFSAGQPLMTLSENGYSVSMSLVSDNINSGVELMSISEPEAPAIQNAVIREKDAKFDTISQAAEIDNKSSIKYQNVKANTDIEYVMNGNDIKENIIIKAKGTNYIYRFDLALDGLTPELVNNTVILRDSESGEEQYIIPEPYMYDADGNISYSVTYTLTNRENGTYLLTVTADSSWINAEGRVFPVVVDPTISVSQTYTVTEDTYIHLSQSTTNFGTSEKLFVSPTQITYIKAPIPTGLPGSATINSATFNIYYYFEGEVTSGTTVLSVFRATHNWNENTLTYNLAREINSNLGLSTTSSASQSIQCSSTVTQDSPALASFNITSAAQLWYEGTPHYGFAIKYTAGNNSTIAFKSRETSYAAYYTINYSPLQGVYAFHNMANTDLCMTIENGSTGEMAYVLQNIYSTSPADTFDRSALFKVSWRPDTGTYVIRSMLNNFLTFEMTSDGFVTKYIPLDDADVSITDTFQIEYDETACGYRISPYNSEYLVTSPSPDDSWGYIIPTEESDFTDEAAWDFVEYTGTQQQGIELYRPSSWSNKGIVVDETAYVSNSVWSTNMGVSTLAMDAATYCSQMISISQSSEQLFLVKALYPGNVTIQAHLKDSSGNILYTAANNYINIPAEGTYYFQSAETEQYMTTDGTAEGSIVEQAKTPDSNKRKWEIEHVTIANSPGYVRIKSVHTNKYLGVDSSSITSIKQYSTQNDYTLWKIERTEKGTLTLTCKATSSNNLQLATPLMTTGNETALTQLAENNSSLREEWYMLKKVISIVNYYDSTFAADSDLVNNIDDAVSFANTIYARNFGIGIYMDGAATYDANAIASQCNDTCNCSSLSHDNHHRSLSKMSDYLYNRTQGREVDHIYVMWAHRVPGYSQDYCWINPDTGQHEAPYALGVVTGNRPVINILYVYTGYTIINPTLQVMSISLAHEITHCLGMSDVYNRKFAAHEADEYSCIMDGLHINSDNRDLRTIQVYNECLNGTRNPFCDDCKPIFSECVSDYTNGIWNISASQ